MKRVIKTLTLILVLALSFPFLASIAQVETVGHAESDICYETDSDTILSELSKQTEYKNVLNEYEFEKALDVAYGKVYRYGQIENGYKVFGRSLNVSVNTNGQIISVNGNNIEIGKLNEVKISEEEAIERAESIYKGFVYSTSLEIYSLYDYEQCPTLAYDIVIGNKRVFISATDGEVIEEIPINESSFISKQTDLQGKTVNVNVTQIQGSYYLSDFLKNIYTLVETKDNSGETIYEYLISSNGNFSDRAAVSAYYNTVKAYDFYTKKQNIGTVMNGLGNKNDSIEGNCEDAGEIPLYIVVHYGDQYENANCGFDLDLTTAYMFVGDGNINGKLYNPAQSSDIIGHEYQHAVTDLTCGLVYLNEAAAISEGVSDIFGALIQGYDPSDDRFWIVGEDSGTAQLAYGRSMKRPLQYQVINYNSRYAECKQDHDHSNCDYGWSHYNATLITHLQYKLWRALPNFFTRERIGVLWFTTLCTLNTDCNFLQFISAFRQAAVDLGYSKDVLKVFDECIFSSGFTSEANTHTVKFVDHDDSLIEELTVSHGGKATAPEDPVRQPNGQIAYVFKSWDQAYNNVTSDLVIKATYNEVPRMCTVKFLNEDGSLLKEEQVLYGTEATPPTNPTKESTRKYDYVFTDWDQKFDNVTEDMTITAQYRAVLRSFTVTFIDDDEKVLKTETVQYGSSATAPEIAEKKSTPQYDYYFERWDVQYNNVTEDLTVRAVYNAVLRQYTVTFVDANGNVLKSETVDYGSSATPPDNTALPSTAQYDFVFNHWEGNFTEVVGDITIKAIYDEILRQYYVHFVSEGEELETITMNYGEKVQLTDLPKQSSKSGKLTFTGWYLDEQCTQPASELYVKSNITLYAGWEKSGAGCGTVNLDINHVLPIILMLFAAIMILRRKEKKVF